MIDMPLIFNDREEAGSILADRLISYKNSSSVIVGISPGGVPIGYKIAQKLKLPLDVVVTVVITSSDHPHIPIASITSGDILTIDRSVQSAFHISNEKLDELVSKAIPVLNDQMLFYKSGKNIKNNIENLFLVDDGTASQISIRAAIESVSVCHEPKKIIFVTPICSEETISFIHNFVDSVVCISHPQHLFTPINWYQSFEPLSEYKLLSYLENRQKNM